MDTKHSLIVAQDPRLHFRRKSIQINIDLWFFLHTSTGPRPTTESMVS